MPQEDAGHVRKTGSLDGDGVETLWHHSHQVPAPPQPPVAPVAAPLAPGREH